MLRTVQDSDRNSCKFLYSLDRSFWHSCQASQPNGWFFGQTPTTPDWRPVLEVEPSRLSNYSNETSHVRVASGFFRWRSVKNMTHRLYIKLEGALTALRVQLNSAETVYDLILAIKNLYPKELRTVNPAFISVQATGESQPWLSDMSVEDIVREFPATRTARNCKNCKSRRRLRHTPCLNHVFNTETTVSLKCQPTVVKMFPTSLNLSRRATKS